MLIRGPKLGRPDRWLVAGVAIVVAQLLAASWAEPFVDTISAGMALLAILCAARTIRLTPAVGVPDRWRWQAGSFAWLLWAAQWIANAVQDSLLRHDQLLAKGLSEARLAVLVFTLMPLAAPGDDRRLRWLDAIFALAFAVLMTILSWPDLFDADPKGPDNTFLYLGYVAMAVFAGLSVVGNPARPLRHMSRALFVTLSTYAVVGITSRELIEHGWVGMDAPVFAYGDLPFLAYLWLIGRATPDGERDAPEYRLVLLARLVPLAVTILIVALSFIVACSLPGNALLAGTMALAILVVYAARAALIEALHHQHREAAFVREHARAAGLTDLMHELRSPLGAIALNASIVRRTVGAQPALDRAAVAIESGCMTISHLLDDVLALERLEAGLTPLAITRHDLAALLREVVAMLAAEAEEYGVTLTAHLVAAEVAVDAAAVRRILTNLIDNALRFTPRGGRVTLSLTYGHRQYQLTVADTGTGLPPEVRAAPFRRFASVARPLNGRRGSGLGLAITHALVQTIGGTITVDPPARDGGTTFRLLLPAA
ncbi:sensor histidine kinase [Sphingomonas sp. NPDC079357]|uniref:sensor histidine kinase n=1 Tax=Sphingomonas sp. NPDC079357 TaxID=3364518 RepID=UPI00384D0C42